MAPLLHSQRLLLLDLGVQLLHFLRTPLQFGFGRFLMRPLLGQLLFLAAQVVAHPFESSAERCQQSLLPFQCGGSLDDLGSAGFVRRLVLRELLGLSRQPGVPFVELGCLFFHFPAGALDLPGPLIDLQSTGLQLLLALLQNSFQTVEADQVGSVMSLLVFQVPASFLQLALAGLALGQTVGMLLMKLLLPAVEQLLLLLGELALAGQFLGLDLQLGFPRFRLLPESLPLLDFRLKMPLALLNFLGGKLDCVLQPEQAVASFAITLVELPADGGQLFLLPSQLRVVLGLFGTGHGGQMRVRC